MHGTHKVMFWIGWVITGLIGLLMAFSAYAKFTGTTEVLAAFETEFGYPAGVINAIAITELACLALYLFPRTAVLGAVLLTGYLGGAVATHVRVSDPFITPAAVGVMVWVALYLRDGRVRALLPLRATPSSGASSSSAKK